MLIRNIDRTHLPRTLADVKGKEGAPLRKTAEGLGSFLNRLSESVRESRSRAIAEQQQGDTLDSGIRAHVRTPMRTFKWPVPGENSDEGAVSSGTAAAAAVEFGLSDEQNEALGKLREVRAITSNASSVAVSQLERPAMQERIDSLLTEIGAERINILSSLPGGKDTGGALFSVTTPESARSAYGAIDSMIMRFLEIKTDIDAENTGAAKSGHEAVLGATGQLREFLLNEGPANAFSRFREINRDNVLGLIRQ
ncbi:MAG: hypothetical protein FWB85_12075 [Chitinispirillia bacterium]|nr:hypothetical protein [Chitinispirillia bacterium]